MLIKVNDLNFVIVKKFVTFTSIGHIIFFVVYLNTSVCVCVYLNI